MEIKSNQAKGHFRKHGEVALLKATSHHIGERKRIKMKSGYVFVEVIQLIHNPEWDDIKRNLKSSGFKQATSWYNVSIVAEGGRKPDHLIIIKRCKP